MSRGKPWTEEHSAILDHLGGLAYDHEIAGLTGHCVDTIQRRRSARGIPAYSGIPIRYGSFAELSEEALKAIRSKSG